jgi:hypothetical protein
MVFQKEIVTMCVTVMSAVVPVYAFSFLLCAALCTEMATASVFRLRGVHDRLQIVHTRGVLRCAVANACTLTHLHHHIEHLQTLVNRLADARGRAEEC